MVSGHLNDMLLVAPVFDGETVVALTTRTSHLAIRAPLSAAPDLEHV